MSVKLKNRTALTWTKGFEYDVDVNGKPFYVTLKVNGCTEDSKTRYNRFNSKDKNYIKKLVINYLDDSSKVQPIYDISKVQSLYDAIKVCYDYDSKCHISPQLKCTLSKSCKTTQQLIGDEKVTIETDNDKIYEWLLKDKSVKIINIMCHKVQFITTHQTYIVPRFSIISINRILPIMNPIKFKNEEKLIKFVNKGKIGGIHKVYPTIYDNNVKLALPLAKMYNSTLKNSKANNYNLVIPDWGINSNVTKIMCYLSNLFANEIKDGSATSWNKFKNFHFNNNLRYLPSVDHTFVSTESDDENEDEDDKTNEADKWWKKPYARITINKKSNIKVGQEIDGSKGKYSINYMNVEQLNNIMSYGTAFYALVTPYIYVISDHNMKGYKMYLNEIYLTKTNTPPEMFTHTKTKKIVSSGVDPKLSKMMCIEV